MCENGVVPFNINGKRMTQWLQVKCLDMMIAMGVPVFMLVVCLPGQGHVTLKTSLVDMEGNLKCFLEIK